MRDKAIDEPCQGGLSRPGSTRQADYFTRRYGKIDFGETVFLACLIAVASIFYLDHFNPSSRAMA